MAEEKPTIIDGKSVADKRLRELRRRVGDASLGLGIIVATDNPATRAYIAQKRRRGEAVGYRVTVRELASDSSLEQIVAACDEFNADDLITAYIVQLPLPVGVDPDRALAAVAPEKDADGLSPANLEKLYAGKPGIVPATPKGILTLLKEYRIPIKGQRVTVVGQGRLAGQPAAALLEQRGAEVTRCDESTADLPAATRPADLLIVAAGHPGLITAEMVKPGAAVIDVGITRIDGKTVGDVDFDAVAKKVSAITPVPGGVGPMTVVSLLENVAELAQL